MLGFVASPHWKAMPRSNVAPIPSPASGQPQGYEEDYEGRWYGYSHVWLKLCAVAVGFTSGSRTESKLGPEGHCVDVPMYVP